MYFRLRLIIDFIFGGVMMAQAQMLKLSGRIINGKNEPLVRRISKNSWELTVGTANDCRWKVQCLSSLFDPGKNMRLESPLLAMEAKKIFRCRSFCRPALTS
jgi:hypothetical protein